MRIQVSDSTSSAASRFRPRRKRSKGACREVHRAVTAHSAPSWAAARVWGNSGIARGVLDRSADFLKRPDGRADPGGLEPAVRTSRDWPVTTAARPEARKTMASAAGSPVGSSEAGPGGPGGGSSGRGTTVFTRMFDGPSSRARTWDAVRSAPNAATWGP